MFRCVLEVLQHWLKQRYSRATASKLFSKNTFLIINKIENLMVVVYNSVVIFRIYLEHFVYR